MKAVRWLWSKKPNAPTEATSNAATTPSCSFCRKTQKEVRKLIQGPDVYICDECVGACNDIIVEEAEEDLDRRRAVAPPDVAHIERHFDELVVGQGAAKRTLSAALFCHLSRRTAEREFPVPKVLLVGPRGCGKSTLAKALCSYELNLVSYHADVSRLTETGYVGENVENLLAAMESSAWAPELAWEGLLVLDGLHHLVRREPPPTSRDISGAEVQRDLVRLYDGLSCEVHRQRPRHPQAPTATFPCNRLLLIASATVDFGTTELEDHQLRKKLGELGFVDELLFRFEIIVQMPQLNVAEFAQVFEQMSRPIIALIERLGGKIEFRPEASQLFAQAAAKSPDGAFALRRPLARLAEKALTEGLRQNSITREMAEALVK